MDSKQWIQSAPTSKENNSESEQLNADKFNRIQTSDQNPYAAQIISLDHLGIDALIEQSPDVLTAERRQTITNHRRRIYQYLSNKHGFRISGNTSLLADMMDCYDRCFFNNLLRQKFISIQHRQIVLQWGGTKFDKKGIAGYCDTCDTTVVTLAFHPDIANIAVDPHKGECVNGILCLNTLACLMIVCEHELVHAVINAGMNQQGAHGKLFKKMAKTLFGHLEYRHEIGRGNGVEKVKLLELYESKHEQLSVGQVVMVKDARLTNDEKQITQQYMGIVMEMKPRVATILNDREAFIFKIPLEYVFAIPSPTERDKQMAKPAQALYALFESRKESVHKSDVVYWVDPDTKRTRSGQVVAKKPLFAEIQCSDQLKLQIPYFRLMILAGEKPYQNSTAAQQNLDSSQNAFASPSQNAFARPLQPSQEQSPGNVQNSHANSANPQDFQKPLAQEQSLRDFQKQNDPDDDTNEYMSDEQLPSQLLSKHSKVSNDQNSHANSANPQDFQEYMYASKQQRATAASATQNHPERMFIRAKRHGTK
jgi:hypothetical protein